MGKLREFLAGQLLSSQMEHHDSPGKSFHAPERIVEREAGCWNCLSFDCGDTAVMHYAACRTRDYKVLREKGLSPERAESILKHQDQTMMPPRSGICLQGDRADFVSATYLCSRWRGRIKPEGKIGDTPQEIRNRLDGDTDPED